MQIITILVLLFSLGVFVFAIQNSTPVDIELLLWSFSDISLVVIILGAFITGVLFTILLNMAKNFKQMLYIKDLSNKNRQLAEEKQHLQHEISRLKTSPHQPDNGQTGK